MSERPFVGRSAELAALGRRLARAGGSRAGVEVTLRGRRQVGKSRLVQEFCDRSGVRYVFFAATKGASAQESVRAFLDELRESRLPTDHELVPTEAPAGWPDALRALAAVLPDAP